jgi:3,4-dihydroxyphenylacetate 2,3-dioxygenase
MGPIRGATARPFFPDESGSTTMAAGIVRAVITPHTPRMGIEAKAPAFLRGVIAGSHALGEEVRGAKPDLLVLQSAHWFSTFNWYVTCQDVHEGVCVASEAPDMIPGSDYRRPGDQEFARALVAECTVLGIPFQPNVSPHYRWDYGTWVPLNYLDPEQRIPAVILPSCLLSSLEECLAVGGAVRAAAERLGRKAVFIGSTALAHQLVRGPGIWPSEAHQQRDREFIAALVEGRIGSAKRMLGDYSREVVAEAGGRVLATTLGCLDEKSGAAYAGRVHGSYGPSSGSGNVSIAVRPVP